MKSAMPYRGLDVAGAQGAAATAAGGVRTRVPRSVGVDGAGSLGRRDPPRGVVRRASGGPAPARPPVARPGVAAAAAAPGRHRRRRTSSTRPRPTWCATRWPATPRRSHRWSTPGRWTTTRGCAVPPSSARSAAARRPTGTSCVRVVEANLGDRTFWLRKAIGWALRDYARTDPDVGVVAGGPAGRPVVWPVASRGDQAPAACLTPLVVGVVARGTIAGVTEGSIAERLAEPARPGHGRHRVRRRGAAAPDPERRPGPAPERPGPAQGLDQRRRPDRQAAREADLRRRRRGGRRRRGADGRPGGGRRGRPRRRPGPADRPRRGRPLRRRRVVRPAGRRGLHRPT